MSPARKSGSSTSLASERTLANSPSPKPKLTANLLLDHLDKLRNSDTPAYSVIEWIVSRQSSAVFLYDLAEDSGFGTLTKEWAAKNPDALKLVSLQTRAGAGLTLVGRLSQGTSEDTRNGSILTAYTTPLGLAQMASALTILPNASTSNRVVIQVASVTPVGTDMALSPTLASIFCVLFSLPKTFAVFLSSTPQESVELASISYRLPEHHVVHIFDHYSSARETTHLVLPPQFINPITSVQDAFADLGYGFFDYAGDNGAQTVVVLLNGPLAATAKVLASQLPGLGVLVVRVLRPWDETAFRQMLPKTVEHVHVMDDVPSVGAQGGLFADVFGTLFDVTVPISPTVHAHRITPQTTKDYLSFSNRLSSFFLGLLPLNKRPIMTPTLTGAQTLKKLLFFSSTDLPSGLLSVVIENFLTHRAIKTRHLVAHDAFSKPGGVTADRVILSPKTDLEDHVPIPLLLPLDPSLTDEAEAQADFVAILDQGLLKSHSVLKYARRGAPVLVLSSWTAEEVLQNIPMHSLELVRGRDLRLCLFNAKGLALEISPKGDKATRGRLEDALCYIAFLRLYAGRGEEGYRLVEKLAQASFGDIVDDADIAELCAKAWEALVTVPFQLVSTADGDSTTKPTVLKEFEFNTVLHEGLAPDVDTPRMSAWHDAAKHIMFQEAFAPPLIPTTSEAQDYTLRPEVPERTYLITTTVNRRLTPKEYHRNLFHLEFDIKGTGLRYELGEALGVHGWNESAEVLEFCDWYGADPEMLITVPAPSRGEKTYHTRTVFQVLQQQIDIFGKPPKSFYAELSTFATQREDRMALHFISSPEGSTMFKKLAEVDTLTFADVLRTYKSARPSIVELCELVGDIAPRHYSIASSQAAVGDRVDLLVVTVEWATPSGSPRCGQCTRYLRDLKPGQQVTVSIKPSVIKLPPSHMQPIIMAGLGTGAAPCRALMQHRAWLAEQNVPTGPLIYYFGSRHRSQEYLYGEEVEAYVEANVITHAGLAFSRDGKQKVYIQHKMMEDAETLVRYLNEDKGVFYLCGPTWPVPDVYATLVNSFMHQTGKTEDDAAQFIEDLKEDQRYVLEVY